MQSWICRACAESTSQGRATKGTYNDSPKLDYLTPPLTQKKALAHKPKLEEQVDGGADEVLAAPKVPPKLAAKVAVR
jgi:hypothetical protein